jgi:hypothetical protein
MSSTEVDTMMSKIESYVEKYNIDDEGKAEMLSLFNQSLIEISQGILNTKNVSSKSSGKQKVSVYKKFKSKKAEEYAEEHGLSMDDFDMDEISKKDVEIKVREISKNKKSVNGASSSSDQKEKTVVVKKDRVICCGINKKGEACKATGTIRPDGAKKKYCFRHAEDYRTFECDSDSSEDSDKEEEKELELELE